MRKNLLYPAIAIIGSIASILSLFLFFVKDPFSTIIALTVSCIILLVVLGYGIWAINRYLKITNVPFIVHSHFVKYEAEADGTHIDFEVYRHIQCKQLVMAYHDYKFKWTGSRQPVIDSKMQKVGKEIIKGATGDYDAIRLDFPHPIMYNDSTIIHFHAQLDDYDRKSDTHVEFRVDYPTQIIHFRVLLKGQSEGFTKVAEIKRKPIDARIGNISYEHVASVKFNSECKSYEYHLVTPQVGYFYRIEWER